MKALIDKKMIERVIAEFEQDNPELSFYEMSPAEFSGRMMKKIRVEVNDNPLATLPSHQLPQGK